jgi:hypothetical protein
MNYAAVHITCVHDVACNWFSVMCIGPWDIVELMRVMNSGQLYTLNSSNKTLGSVYQFDQY